MSVTSHVAAMPTMAAWVEVLWLDQAARTYLICGRSPKWLRQQRAAGLRIRTEPTANPRSYVLHSELVAFLKARAIQGDE
jgi:hypothetical protein